MRKYGAFEVAADNYVPYAKSLGLKIEDLRLGDASTGSNGGVAGKPNLRSSILIRSAV
ncbi:MAG: hypothetical protein R2854_03975 [Caldilineaceae bacterium]